MLSESKTQRTRASGRTFRATKDAKTNNLSPALTWSCRCHSEAFWIPSTKALNWEKAHCDQALLSFDLIRYEALSIADRLAQLALRPILHCRLTYRQPPTEQSGKFSASMHDTPNGNM